ncbi:hypothetical protein ASQ44_07500 (plasmid) [Rickettsia rhipicephali]|uniref:hypothetical protein n=1 Tax=Rickettsia rhipicephali TaxID=33992 RepID=UPI00070A49AA|nr:hypothetical protein [Rickettsia rhipicephali]ALN41915.1 hypothetical protein ASQ44_07500 [Rickettsia rhipicephali]
MQDDFMLTHTFTTADAAKQTDRKLKDLTFFDPKYDPLCKLQDGSIKMNNTVMQKSFNTDINRSPNFYIETEQGLTNLTQEIKLQYGDDRDIDYNDVYNLLTNKYKLSQQQSEYILATSYQGSIAGGLTGFGTLIVDYIEDPMLYMNRNGNMSKVIIDKDNNLSYVGGQKITFDCDRTAYNDIIKDNIHTQFQSKNYVAATITAQLGKLGASEFEPKVVISAMGDGISGDKIIGELQKIDTNIQPLNAEQTLRKYNDFANSIMEVNGQQKRYQQAIKTEIDKRLSTDVVEPQAIENLKKLNFVPEALSTTILNNIDKQLNDKGYNITSDHKKDMAHNTAITLEKFIDLPKGYVYRFSRDIVNQCAESRGLNKQKKSIMHKMVSYIKDVWNGYNKNYVKNIFLTDLQVKAQEISLKLKCSVQDNIRNNVQNIKKQKIVHSR